MDDERERTSLTVTFKLLPEERARLDAIARAGHRSRSRQIQRWVERALIQEAEPSREAA